LQCSSPPLRWLVPLVVFLLMALRIWMVLVVLAVGDGSYVVREWFRPSFIANLVRQFILEGLLTVCVGVAAYLFIVNYPDTARWLKPKERTFIQKRLAADGDASENEGFSWHNVSLCLRDPKCWLYCFGFHFMSLPLYTLSLFLPTIIADLGYSAATAQLMTIPVCC
jgi:hypothetical protein